MCLKSVTRLVLISVHLILLVPLLHLQQRDQETRNFVLVMKHGMMHASLVDQGPSGRWEIAIRAFGGHHHHHSHRSIDSRPVRITAHSVCVIRPVPVFIFDGVSNQSQQLSIIFSESSGSWSSLPLIPIANHLYPLDRDFISFKLTENLNRWLARYLVFRRSFFSRSTLAFFAG